MPRKEPAGQDVEKFAEIIRARRRQLRLSQEAVAAQAFGNPDRKSYVSALENARRTRITVDTATKLAAALDIPATDLPISLRPMPLPGAGVAPDGPRAQDIASAFNAQLRRDLSRTAIGAYRISLGRGLQTLEDWTGPPFSTRSLAVSFALSFFYVVATGLIAYGADGGAVGDAVPFQRPAWALGAPGWLLAILSAGTLMGSGLWAYRAVLPPDTRRLEPRRSALEIVGGAAICGAGCAIAGLFGAEPIAVALSVALFAFGALSAWPIWISAAAGAAGPFIAGIGNALIDDRGLPFGLVWFLVFASLLGVSAGAAASAVARTVPRRIPAALAGAGAGVGIGACGAGLALSLSPQADTSGINAGALIALMWVVLPVANALSDYLSLGISHGLARKLRRLRPGWAAIGMVVLIDLAAALGLTVATVLMIGTGLHLAEAGYDLDFQAAAFVAEAMGDPWGDGLWLSLMVLTTLVWTYAHIALVVGPVLAARLVEQIIEAPLRRRIARLSEAGRIDTTSGTWLAIRHLVFAGLIVLFAALPLLLVLALFDDLAALLV